MENRRLSQIDAWRGFAIFCVILYHSIIVYPINLEDISFLKSLHDYINIFNMPLFFFIAGTCFSYKGNYKEYIIKKIKRIATPYFTVRVLNYLCKFILPSVVHNQAYGTGFIRGILLFGGDYWFLYVMFEILLIYPLIASISNKYIKYIIEIFLIVLYMLDIGKDMFCLTLLFKYFVFFNTGYILKDIIIKHIDTRNNVVLFIVLFILSILLFVVNIKLNMRIIKLINTCVIIFTTYQIINNSLFIKLFERYGKYSLQIYCLNGFLLVIARTIICKITSLAIIIIPFIILVCLCLSYFVIKYVISKFKIACLLLGL